MNLRSRIDRLERERRADGGDGCERCRRNPTITVRDEGDTDENTDAETVRTCENCGRPLSVVRVVHRDRLAEPRDRTP